MKTAMKTERNPTSVTQLSFSNLRIQATKEMKMVARNDHHTVQAPCVDKAFIPMEVPRMPEPAERT
jgi:hypothetical protein